MSGMRTGWKVKALKKHVSENCGMSDDCSQRDRETVRVYVAAARDLTEIYEAKIMDLQVKIKQAQP